MRSRRRCFWPRVRRLIMRTLPIRSSCTNPCLCFAAFFRKPSGRRLPALPPPPPPPPPPARSAILGGSAFDLRGFLDERNRNTKRRSCEGMRGERKRGHADQTGEQPGGGRRFGRVTLLCYCATGGGGTGRRHPGGDGPVGVGRRGAELVQGTFRRLGLSSRRPRSSDKILDSLRNFCGRGVI